MRQAGKVKTKFQSRISIILDPGKKIPKKIVKNSKDYKTSSQLYFQLKRDEIGRERQKKILVPDSVHSRPGQENSKKNSKKIKKPLSGIIVSQNGMRQAEKERTKNLVPNSVHTRPEQENCEKNQNSEKQKKKKFSPEFRSFPTWARSSEKIAKKFKKIKYHFPALFLAKMG